MNASTTKTTTEYQERIGAVLRYIAAHLDEPLSLDVLAEVAGFSPYHFHRIFAAMVGEPVGSYVRRLRLDGAARQLLMHSARPVTEIALDVGYETPSAFAKAFRQHYGISPSRFRQSRGRSARPAWQPVPLTARYTARRFVMQSEIRTTTDRRVLYARRCGMKDGNMSEAAQDAFGTLMQFAHQRGIGDKWTECLAIYPDDPQSVAPDQVRIDAGLVLPQPVEVQTNGDVGLQTLPGGRVAVFLHTGPYSKLGKTWDAIYRDWLPSSGKTPRDVPPYELYVDDPEHTPEAELRTEIHVPIE